MLYLTSRGCRAVAPRVPDRLHRTEAFVVIHVVDCVKLMAIFALTLCGLIICHFVCASLAYLVVLPIVCQEEVLTAIVTNPQRTVPTKRTR